MRQIKMIIWAGALVLGAGTAQSETLADAMVSAYNNSNLLELNRAVLKAADEDVALAVSTLRPVINYNASHGYFWDLDTGFLPDGLGGTERQNTRTLTNTVELTLSLSLYEFGRNRLAVEAAKEAVLAARQSLVAEEQAVIFAAVQGYTAVRRAQEFVDLRRNNVRVLAEEQRAANDRFEVGEVTRTDVAQADARLAEAQANLVSAQGDLETAREQFKLAVGRYPGNLAPPPAFPSVPASLTDARNTAVVTHPSIRQAQHSVAAQEINVDISQREVLPSFSVQGAAGYSDSASLNNDLEPQASLSLQFGGPIYQGGRINALYRQAAALLAQNQANLLQTTLNVEERVGFAWANLQTARARLVSTNRQIEAQEIAFEGTREEATLGARTTLDVLNAEQELLDARGDRIEAQTIEQDAYYFLLSTMGLLTSEQLGLNVVSYDPEAYYNSVRTSPSIFTSDEGIKLDRVMKSLGKQ